MTTSGAANDKNFVKISFPFQWTTVHQSTPQRTCRMDMSGYEPDGTRTTICNAAWQRHYMTTIVASLALCAGNPSVTGRFTAQRNSNVDCWLFIVSLSKHLDKPSSGRWNEPPLWPCCDVSLIIRSVDKLGCPADVMAAHGSKPFMQKAKSQLKEIRLPLQHPWLTH